MDPIVCCLLGICCPPNSPEQLQAVTRRLLAADVCKDPADAARVASFFIGLVHHAREAMKAKP